VAWMPPHSEQIVSRICGALFRGSLEWENVKNINLRKITKEKKKPTDPPAMGDSYFRYPD
ncbi:hypothetical protein BRO03_12260, partial [Xanthomonas oryzae pv. oryzae]